MIDIKAKKHDRFTVEFKLGYNINQNGRKELIDTDINVGDLILISKENP